MEKWKQRRQAPALLLLRVQGIWRPDSTLPSVLCEDFVEHASLGRLLHETFVSFERVVEIGSAGAWFQSGCDEVSQLPNEDDEKRS